MSFWAGAFGMERRSNFLVLNPSRILESRSLPKKAKNLGRIAREARIMFHLDRMRL